MMRALLISANTETINMPTIPVGLGLVAEACDRAGHEIEFLDLRVHPDPTAAVKEAVGSFDPRTIGVSVRNIDDQSSRDTRFLLEQVKPVISACREASPVPIVLGGAGYSIFPQAALTYLGADYGIEGEGEAALPLLLDRLATGADPADVPGLHRPGRPATGPARCDDLDALAFTDPHRFDYCLPAGPQLWMPFQTRRGCPLDCSYCSTRAIEGGLIRRRSIEKTVEAIAAYVDAGFTRFYFTDNTFNLPRSHAAGLCQAIIDAGLEITWRCIAYPHQLDPGLVELMARADCAEVSLGFESGAAAMLRRLNKRFDPQEVRAIALDLGRAGIRRMGFLLLGGPGETVESARESLDFAESLDLEMMRVTVGIRVYPHTALARATVEQGVIAPDDDLLEPRFYVAADLEPTLRRMAAEQAAGRPNWIL